MARLRRVAAGTHLFDDQNGRDALKTTLRWIRRLLDVALVALVGSVLALVLAANIGPGLGHQMVVIRGSSMSPAIPLGSMVDVTRVQPSDLKIGDVVTVQSPGGTAYTHRINRIVQLPDGMYIETQGDAVGHPDAPLLPVAQVTGRVSFGLPFAGFLLYLLTVPTGVLSILCLALTMLFSIWLLEEAEWGNERDEVEYESELAGVLASGQSSEPAG